MQMQVWDAVSGEKIEFSSDNYGESVACIVENDLMIEGLHKQLEKLENVSVMNSSSLTECDLKKDGLERNLVKLKSGEELSCDLLVRIFLSFNETRPFFLISMKNSYNIVDFT